MLTSIDTLRLLNRVTDAKGELQEIGRVLHASGESAGLWVNNAIRDLVVAEEYLEAELQP